jgi:phage antirepressor YoqD-like protein
MPQNYIEALEHTLALARKIAVDAPKVLFAETCMDSRNSILIRELAKVACKDGILIGEKGMYRWMRNKKILMPDNMPYQREIDAGHFKVIERPIKTKDGVLLKFTTRVLPRGQEYIINRLKREFVKEIV